MTFSIMFLKTSIIFIGRIAISKPTSKFIIFSNKHGLIKTDANGNELWNNTDSVSYIIHYGQQTVDGGYICTGMVNNDSTQTTQEDVLLIKFNSNGHQQWVRTWDFGSQKDEEGYYVEQTADGGYILSVGAEVSQTICGCLWSFHGS